VRILHFADLHLGIDLYGTPDSRTGLSSRVMDTLRALDAIIDRAIAEPVDIVLFAGDAFKNRDPNPTLQREFARRIVRLAAANIPIVLLVGNHDMPGVLTRAAATEIYEVLQIPGVHVARDLELHTINTLSGDLQVLTVPWVNRSTFAGDERIRALADDDQDKSISNAVEWTVRELVTDLDPALPAVLLGHLSLEGAQFGFERSIMLGKDVTLGRDALRASQFDYVALGHIHKHQQHGSNPPAVYAGSPERVDFGEEHEPKGFVLVEILPSAAGRQTSWRFEELPSRVFRTLRIDAPGDAPMATVERELTGRRTDITGAIVRVFVNVDQGREASVNVAEVRRLLTTMDPAFIARVSIESAAVSRARMEIAADEALDPMRMLERWVEMKNYDGELRQRMLALGQELIQRQRERERGGS
jgi:exonuclease SbcD